MTASKRQKTLPAAILLAALTPLLIITGDTEVIPVAVVETTVDVFQTIGALLAGFLTGYIFFTALKSEGE